MNFILPSYQTAKRSGLAAIALGMTASAAIAQDVNAATEPVFEMPSLWDLAVQGGWFMIPIGIASVITIAFTLERLAGLRRGRILPRALISSMREMVAESNVDPRQLWEACEQRRSPLANVAKAAVLKIGRTQPEVEKAVEDAVQREIGGMTRNMRPINVVASISPLLGLLGTVQGMIMAFMVTSTTSSTGTAKAQELAHGIYTALVTTFAGLCVAVVSVVLANFLEGRIERLLRKMEEVFLDLLPLLEKFEGRVRISEVAAGEVGGIKIRNLQQTTATVDQQAVAEERQPKAGNKIQSSNKPRSQKRPTLVSENSLPTAAEKTVVQKITKPSLRSNFDR